jgi:D-alanyl-D-alanine dipeptidase
MNIADGVPESMATFHVPSGFLDHSLSADQLKKINEIETNKIAKYCVEVQGHLSAVPINENFDKMVFLPTYLNEVGVNASYSNTAFHDSCGIYAGKPREFWARAKFAQRIAIMGLLLDSIELSLHVEDAFRPVGVQEGLFARRVRWTELDHPKWTREQIIIEAKSKTAVSPRLASHKAGAAIDTLLTTKVTKEPIDFGHAYPDGGALVFPKSIFLTKDQWMNRQLFQISAQLSGLTLYVGEDWHVSFGDNLAALDLKGNVDMAYIAQYGPVKEFSKITGEIINVYNGDEYDKTFDYLV